LYSPKFHCPILLSLHECVSESNAHLAHTLTLHSQSAICWASRTEAQATG